MKILKLAAVLAAAVIFSGCAVVKDKASGYYLSKTRKTLAAQNLSQPEMEKAYSDLARSLEYAPSSLRALEVLEQLTARAGKIGFSKGPDLEITILKRVLRASPANWQAYAALITALSARGDLYSLNGLASNLEGRLASSAENRRPYEASLGLALCYASIVPWVEEEGYLSLNKDPDLLIEKAREYARVRRRAEELQALLANMDSADPGLRRKAPQPLLSAAEVALADLAGSRVEAERVYATVSKLDLEPAFFKAVGLTVRGNNALVKKDYSGARAFYQSAMQNYPGFIDAAKQLAEVDFQEGAGMALAAGGVKAGKQLLDRAYSGSGAVIKAVLKSPAWMPFMARDKFLSDTYAVRAAVILAVNAIEKGPPGAFPGRTGRRGGPKNKAGLEKEFKAALDEAVRLNPRGGLAKELLERYTKEGF
ncbi:MAG: hypothetical protein WCW52_10475 [Elusimicrobiales bacterium]|jgi:hypothetical protein